MTRNHNPTPQPIPDSLARLGVQDPAKADKCCQDVLDAVARAGRVLAVFTDKHVSSAQREKEKERIQKLLFNCAHQLKTVEATLTIKVRHVVRLIDAQPLPPPAFTPIGRVFLPPAARLYRGPRFIRPSAPSASPFARSTNPSASPSARSTRPTTRPANPRSRFASR